MATQKGTILTLWGHTNPFYNLFTLDVLSLDKCWSYDDAPVSAGNFSIGIYYTIVTIGTTDFTLIGASSNTIGVVFKASGIGTGTGTATIAGATILAQPLPSSGQLAGGYSWKYAPATPNLTDGAEIGGQPQTPGSPYPTQNFIVEVLYTIGTGPNYTMTFDNYRVLALTAANSAFGLIMT